MSTWVDQEFATIELGDKRLIARLKIIMRRLAETPNLSIKAAFQGWAEVMAAYRFFENKRTSIEAILKPHQDATCVRVAQHKRVLLIQDTTELDYSTKKTVTGTGALSTKSRQGFFAHNQLVVTPERLPLGIWHTDIFARKDDENEENDAHDKAKARKQKPIEEKESFRWLEGYRDACDLSERIPETQVISCADRECDIYEIFNERQARILRGQTVAHYLIRCNQDRCLATDTNSKAQSKEMQDVENKIRNKVENSKLMGTLTIAIKAKDQHKKVKGGSRKKVHRSGREAVLEIRTASVTLRPPYRKHGKLPEVTHQVVMATEINPPENEDPIDWVLLTSLPIPDFEAAVNLIDLYMARWEVEVFHRVLKTGCKVEELQLKTDDRIRVAVALYMIVAWRVLYMMKLGRECPDLPCDVVFEEDEWRACWTICHGHEAAETKPSLGQLIMAVARLGGFLARNADGSPGPQAIWQGMSRIRDFTLAWQVLTQKRAPVLS